MPLIAKCLFTLFLLFVGLEVLGRWWLRLEKRHYGYRTRMRAEKTASFVTVAFATGVLIVSVWTQ